jgi:hypothetical protein
MNGRDKRKRAKQRKEEEKQRENNHPLQRTVTGHQRQRPTSTGREGLRELNAFASDDTSLLAVLGGQHGDALHGDGH